MHYIRMGERMSVTCLAQSNLNNHSNHKQDPGPPHNLNKANISQINITFEMHNHRYVCMHDMHYLISHIGMM